MSIDITIEIGYGFSLEVTQEVLTALELEQVKRGGELNTTGYPLTSLYLDEWLDFRLFPDLLIDLHVDRMGIETEQYLTVFAKPSKVSVDGKRSGHVVPQRLEVDDTAEWKQSLTALSVMGAALGLSPVNTEKYDTYTWIYQISAS